MIEFSGVHFAYPGGPPILRGVDLTVADGERIGLVGSNGSGKSTLVKLTNGLLLPTSGKVTVDGIDTADVARLPEIRQRVGIVFQNPDNQIVGSIVEDDVAFGPENLGLATAEIGSRVGRALGQVGLVELARRSPMTLSGGQKQRLAVAGVLAMLPSHVVLDEATAMLDPHGRRDLLAVAADLGRLHGIAILQITHLLDELLAVGRIVALEKGAIAFDGPRADFFDDPPLLVKLGLEPPPLLALYHELRRLGLLERLDVPDLAGMADAIAAGSGARA